MPLTCLGYSGYMSRLTFFFVSPLVIIVILFVCHLVGVVLHDGEVDFSIKQTPAAVHRIDPSMKRRLSEEQAHPDLGPVRAPVSVLLRRATIASISSTIHFLYLVYPVITTVAFEAFLATTSRGPLADHRRRRAL